MTQMLHHRIRSAGKATEIDHRQRGSADPKTTLGGENRSHGGIGGATSGAFHGQVGLLRSWRSSLNSPTPNTGDSWVQSGQILKCQM
jgi:hypothetical protein